MPRHDGEKNMVGNTITGTKTMNISQGILDAEEATEGPYAGKGKTKEAGATLDRTVAHEFGHSATLMHPSVGTMSGNLMEQTSEEDAGTNITEEQILEMEKAYNEGKMNRDQ